MADFHGVMPPIPTPFNQDYSINIEALRGLVEHLITGGVHAIIPTGSTGEFARLSMDERKEVLEVCLDQAGGRVPVIAGTAAPGTREVIELSAHRLRVGTHRVGRLRPEYQGRPRDARDRSRASSAAATASHRRAEGGAQGDAGGAYGPAGLG